MRNPWARLSGESDAAYAAFHEWLHTNGDDRPNVYEWAAKRQDDIFLSAVLQWAVSDHWHLRAKEYDEWVGKRQLIRNFPLYSPLCLLARKIVQTELERYSAMQDATEHPGVIQPRLIPQLMAEVRRAEEMVRMYANEVKTEGEVYDFTKLDLEELHILEKLHIKAKV